MEKSLNKLVKEIEGDENLRPYFVDYIGENLKTAFHHLLRIRSSAAPRFEETASIKLQALLDKLQNRVPKQHLENVVAEVCKHYAAMVHLSFQDQAFAASNRRVSSKTKYTTPISIPESNLQQK